MITLLNMTDMSIEEGPSNMAFMSNSWTRRLSKDLLAELQIRAPTSLPALPLSRSMTTASVGHVQSPLYSRPNSSRPGSSANRYTPIGTLAGNDLGKSLAYVPPISAKDCLEELKEVLLKPLEKVSRQRLRAILYGFRRKGGLENRISVQHMTNVLREHEVNLSSRIIMLIRKSYQDKYGIDYESLWKMMCSSQALTGRDSVICLHGKDGLYSGRKQSVSGTGIDPRDRELISQLKHEFTSSREHNLAEIRDLCEQRDTLRHGLLQSRVLQKICAEQRLPVSKPLLNLLLARCDDEKNGQISWTDFVGLLEKAYSELPEMPQVAQRHQPLRTESETDLPTANQLPAIVEKSAKSGKVSSKKQRGPPKSTRKEKKHTPIPTPATLTDDDLSNEEIEPRSTSSASLTSKNSSGEESILLSESLGKIGRVDEEQSMEDSHHLEGDSVMKDNQKKDGDVHESSNGKVHQSKETADGMRDKSVHNKPAKMASRGKSKTDLISKPLCGIAGKIKAKVNKKNVGKKEASVEERSPNSKGEDGVNQDDSRLGNHDDAQTTKHEKDAAAGMTEIKKEEIVRLEETNEGTTMNGTGGAEKLDGGDNSPPPKEIGDLDTSDEPIAVVKEANVISEHEGPEQQTGNNEKDHEDTVEYETVEYVADGRSLLFYKPDSYRGVDGPTYPPDKTLTLDWVYGYQGNNCRSNLFAMATGELVYFSAHVVVLYDPVEHKQKHYLGHQSQVQSLAVHINGSTVASGQRETAAAQACVHIWNGTNLQTLLVLGADVFKNGVNCLDFAASHGYLLAIDASPNPVLSVWDWKNELQFAAAPVGTDAVRQARFQPKDPSVIISVGRDHLVFWNLDKEGGKLEEGTKANFERNSRAKYMDCVAFRPNGDIVTGDSNGTVYVWPRKGNTISLSLVNIHEGPVYALRFLRGLLLTGGRDGRVRAWSLGSRGAKEMCCSRLSSDAGGARILAVAGSRIYVGTTMNCIYSLTITASGPPFDSAAKMDVVTQGHYGDASGVTALTVEPLLDHFITVGHDGITSLVDGCHHRPLWRCAHKGSDITCVDVCGTILACGTKEASILLCSFDLTGCQVVFQLDIPGDSSSSAPISCLRFSPDGKRLAVGDEAGTIHVCEVAPKELKMCRDLKGHQGSVRSLDWSLDGQAVRSSGDNCELIVWNMQSFERQDSVCTRNVVWASHQALHGFNCKGIWEQEGASPRDVDATTEEPRLMIAAEDHRIDIHHHPSTQLKTTIDAPAEVSRLRFLSGSGHVVSVGGSITLQWSVSGRPT